jgi:short-subunit dehydrogenase
MELAGQKALLTGATGGLGRAIAEALAARGAVLLLSARKRDALEAMAEGLPGEGHRVLPSDLAEPGAVEALVAEAGEVDVLIANAGVGGPGLLDDYTPEELSSALRVNLEVPMLMAQALAPGMVERRGGHLVFIASLNGKAGTPRTSLYCATKFGLRGFALALRTDLLPKGVGVSLVSPGFIRDAGMFADSGAKPPPPMGTSTSAEVGSAVVRAVERDKAEIVVAPPVDRFLSHLALTSPSIADRVQRGSTGQKAAEQLAESFAKAKG